MKSVLLTGASGFIGAHCLDVLLKKGFYVHAVSAKGRRNYYHEQVEWHHADLHNAEHVLRLTASVKPEYLLHLAWDVTHGIYWRSLENLRWVKTSLNLLEAFVSSGGKRALLVGSCAEYDWSYGYLTESLTPLNPGTLYGVCKDALRRVAVAAAEEAGASLAWARLFFLFGPGEHQSRLVPAVVTSLLKGEEAFLTHGEQIRDYLYVKDAAAALIALLESEVQGAVNIASGRPLVLKNLITALAKLTGRAELLRFGALRVEPDDQELLLANTRRLNVEVSFSPRYSLEEGLKETVNFWRTRLK